MVGPCYPGNLRCLFCHELFGDGEIWEKVWDDDHVYFIGVRDK